MSQEPWSGHPARLGQSKGEKVGRKAGGLGPTTPDEMLRPCRPPVPTPRAEPLAFGGLAEGGEGDPPLVLMGLRGFKRREEPGNSSRSPGREEVSIPAGRKTRCTLLSLRGQEHRTPRPPHGESGAMGCGFSATTTRHS